MKKGVNIYRIRLLVFVICFMVLMLFLTRMAWSTTHWHKTANVFRQKVNSTVTVVPAGHNNISFLRLVIQFPLLSITSSNDTEIVRERQLEYIQTLQRNLAHPLVNTVHILCENDHVMKFILHNFKQDAHKIILKNIGRRMHYSDALAYVSNELLLETCVITNADIYIGKGFEQLDPNILKQGTMYALTRHEDREHMKACPGTKDFCGKQSKYIGSHDAFVMNLVRPLPDEVLQKTNFRPNMNSAENVFIYMLETYGHFRFKNPCSILYIIHHHCRTERDMRYRLVEGKRLNAYLKVPARVVPFSGL